MHVSTFQASLAGLLASSALVVANNLIRNLAMLALELLFVLELMVVMMMRIMMGIMNTRFHIVIEWFLTFLRSAKREFRTWSSQGPRRSFAMPFDPCAGWPPQAHAATSRARAIGDRIGVDARGSHVTWRWRNTWPRRELEIGDVVRDDVSKRGRSRRAG